MSFVSSICHYHFGLSVLTARCTGGPLSQMWMGSANSNAEIVTKVGRLYIAGVDSYVFYTPLVIEWPAQWIGTSQKLESPNYQHCCTPSWSAVLASTTVLIYCLSSRLVDKLARFMRSVYSSLLDQHSNCMRHGIIPALSLARLEVHAVPIASSQEELVRGASDRATIKEYAPYCRRSIQRFPICSLY